MCLDNFPNVEEKEIFEDLNLSRPGFIEIDDSNKVIVTKNAIL